MALSLLTNLLWNYIQEEDTVFIERLKDNLTYETIKYGLSTLKENK